jgi:hypothetical protein
MKHDRTVSLAARPFGPGLRPRGPVPDTVAHSKLGPIFGFVLRWRYGSLKVPRIRPA